jgi:hypothetical protein
LKKLGFKRENEKKNRQVLQLSAKTGFWSEKTLWKGVQPKTGEK